jgi:hypothetical protein
MNPGATTRPGTKKTALFDIVNMMERRSAWAWSRRTNARAYERRERSADERSDIRDLLPAGRLPRVRLRIRPNEPTLHGRNRCRGRGVRQRSLRGRRAVICCYLQGQVVLHTQAVRRPPRVALRSARRYPFWRNEPTLPRRDR